MQRTLGRAYQRLQGNHPRRPDGHRATELFCDALLLLGVLAVPVGAWLFVWGCVARFDLVRLGGGVVFLILGPLVLLLWERLAWEPFGKRLSQLS